MAGFKEPSDEERQKVIDVLNKTWLYWVHKGFDPSEMLYFNLMFFSIAMDYLKEKAKEN